MNCLFCQQPGSQIGDTGTYSCAHCPFNLHFNTHIIWLSSMLELYDYWFALEWYLKNDLIARLDIYKRLKLEGSWIKIATITNGADKITPANIETKLPYLLTFL